jgi:hypothetical protein
MTLIVPDVDILVYAFRTDSPEHADGAHLATRDRGFARFSGLRCFGPAAND